MGSENGFYSVQDFTLDARWLIDPKHLFVGPKIGEGAHAKVHEGKTVKLADFGLAREESLTKMMTVETGTYRWMAPELCSTATLRQGEKKHYNNKVDAYSFAIVLWELVHNKLPFEGMSNLQAAYAAAFKNVRPSAENLPKDLALILTSCWAEDPNSRPGFHQIIPK
ncbi:hypothetical protein Ancab_008624 [Ancistrocladus abbreviatus]